jgi:hypothetical protein
MHETIIVAGRTVLAAIRCSTMLRITVYATLIVTLIVGAASAQTYQQGLPGYSNAARTDAEKKNDRELDRTYESAMKRVPNAEKKKSDPWADARSAPPAAGKNKQLRIVSGEKKVSCNADEVLVSVVCSEDAPDGAGCSAGSTTTGVCMHK